MPATSSTIRYGMLLQTKKNKKNQDTTIMKAKYALIALLAITFWGCDDNTAGLGLGMFPGSDQNINGKLSTFDVTTESVHAGKIYAMTNVGYVGKFTDETFGNRRTCWISVAFPDNSETDIFLSASHFVNGMFIQRVFASSIAPLNASLIP